MSQQPSDNLFIGDLPDGITKEEVEAIFGPFGELKQCRVNTSLGGKTSALVRFGSVEEATWLVDQLNGNLAEGLSDPVVVRFANASGGGGNQGGQSWGKENQSWGKTKGGGASKGGASYGKSWGGKELGARIDPYNGKGKGNTIGGQGGGKGFGKSPAPSSFQVLFKAAHKGGLLGGGHVPNECQVFVKNLPGDTTNADLFKLFAPFGAIGPTGATAMLAEDGSCKGFGFVDFVDAACAQAAVATLHNFTLPDESSIQVSIKIGNKGGKS